MAKTPPHIDAKDATAVFRLIGQEVEEARDALTIEVRDAMDELVYARLEEPDNTERFHKAMRRVRTSLTVALQHTDYAYQRLKQLGNGQYREAFAEYGIDLDRK